MANLAQYGYDESQVEASTSFRELPVGKYKVVILDSPVKQSKAGHDMIALEMRVNGGQEDGYEFTEFLNINHPESNVQEAAFKTVKQITMAQGKQNITDTSELHGTEFVAEVIESKRKPGTFFKKYLPLKDLGSAPAQPQQQAPYAQQSNDKPAWS